MKNDIDICDVQAPTPTRTKVTTAQLAREERAVMQLLRDALPSLAHLVLSESSIALLARAAKLDTWRLSLTPRRQLTIQSARVAGGLADEAQTVWTDVKAAQSRLRSAIRVVQVAESAERPLVRERDPLVQRLVTCEAKDWMLHAESVQFQLKLPDLRETEDDRDCVLTGEVRSMTTNTIMLARVAVGSADAAAAARIRHQIIALKRPSNGSMKRIGEYFSGPPQCGDIVSVAVRLHRGRLTGEVCGATLSSDNAMARNLELAPPSSGTILPLTATRVV